MEHMYEEVEMSTEQQTDSENDMQEVIVGEEVIEQTLDDCIIFEGRPVRRKIPPVTKKEYITASPRLVQSPSTKPVTIVKGAGVVARPTLQQKVNRTPTAAAIPTARPLSVTRPIKTTSMLSTPQPLSLKRKMENSPLVVKLDGIKKPNLGTSPIARALANIPKTATPPTPKVRYVKTTDVQTDLTGDLIDQYQQVIEEGQQRVQELENKLRKFKYTPDMFENDDKKTHYFTGLENFVNMITLFNNCEPDLPASSTMSKFEMFILTLMKLRLKLAIPLLGYMFGVSPKTALFFFNESMTVVYGVMRQIFEEVETVETK